MGLNCWDPSAAIFAFVCGSPVHLQWALLHAYSHTLFNNLFLGGWGLVSSEVSGGLPFGTRGPKCFPGLMERAGPDKCGSCFEFLHFLLVFFFFLKLAFVGHLLCARSYSRYFPLDSFNWEGNRKPKPHLVLLSRVGAKQERSQSQPSSSCRHTFAWHFLKAPLSTQHLRRGSRRTSFPSHIPYALGPSWSLPHWLTSITALFTLIWNHLSPCPSSRLRTEIVFHLWMLDAIADPQNMFTA